MLIEHHSSHLAQGPIFPFHHAILGRRIRARKLVFKTQVMAKGFEARVFEFRAIVTADHVTRSFKGKTECIDHVCARIKLHTRLDIMNTKTVPHE
jgi:hypothetical protein